MALCPYYDPEKCPVSTPIPFLPGVVADIDACLIAELQKLWDAGIPTEASHCGNGAFEEAYILVDKNYAAEMEAQGYVINPDAACFAPTCNAYMPKTKLPPKKRK